jgi:PAS domain S-box-containing protein
MNLVGDRPDHARSFFRPGKESHVEGQNLVFHADFACQASTLIDCTGHRQPQITPMDQTRQRVAISPEGLGEAVLASESDAVVATDREGIITFWNPGAERIFGFATSEAVGRSLDLIVPDNLRARHWTGYRRVMATGESRYGHGDLLSVPALTKDGSRVSVEFTILMLRDDGDRPAGTAAILRDVTKRFEETRQLKRELAQSLQARRGSTP